MPINGTGSIIECITEYQKSEDLEGEDEPTCEQCKEKRPMRKQLSISKCPSLLILHLKRFGNGGQSGSKDISLITFPIENLKIRTETYKLQGKTNSTNDSYCITFIVLGIINARRQCVGTTRHLCDTAKSGSNSTITK